MYSAINIDTKKALEAIRESREYQINASALRVQKEQAYMEGVNKGLDIAEGLFRCSNYEKEKEPSTSSVDEACVLLSDRIRKRLLEENTDDAN